MKFTAKEVRVESENTSRATVVKEDYDSSATETADEGIGGTADNESNELQHSTNESEKKEQIVTDLSVSDILSDVIEKQFTKEHSNREVNIILMFFVLSQYYLLKYNFFATERKWFYAHHIIYSFRSGIPN